MDYKVYIPNDDELKKFNAERIEGLYTEGLERKNLVAKEMEFGQFRDRHFITKTFGSLAPGDIHAHRMNGNTGQLSYNEYYHEWREKVLSTLSSSTIPTYFRLSFASLPNVLVDEKYRHAYDGDITQMALEAFDKSLQGLLDIIKQLPDTSNRPEIEKVLVSYGVFSLTASGGVIKNGVRIELPPKQSKLMSALIKRSGEPLSRSDCIDVLWNENDASDGFLNNPKNTTEKINKQLSNHVNKLNTYLRDSVDKKQYVNKAPGERGYYLSS